MESDKFYQEANDMQEGWGNYLRHIDELRERFNNKGTFNLDEACWLLYAELFIPSDTYMKFKTAAKGYPDMTWDNWKTIFYNWKENSRRI